jgi:hypothetical protein
VRRQGGGDAGGCGGGVGEAAPCLLDVAASLAAGRGSGADQSLCHVEAAKPSVAAAVE